MMSLQHCVPLERQLARLLVGLADDFQRGGQRWEQRRSGTATSRCQRPWWRGEGRQSNHEQREPGLRYDDEPHAQAVPQPRASQVVRRALREAMSATGAPG